ncbi:MAG: methyltransferase domain-containing protein [Acidobacteriia bacterium]|nr:methyltransferase domain-containing protein [Terriglobia bacterium]
MPPPASSAAQSLAVKRAEVEFHNFASLGETDRALASYADENTRRGLVIRAHRDFIGAMTPFLEIGANAGHTSYMLANEFGADGFALDISADALRHGVALMDLWKLSRAPIRLGGDALHLPFRDGSLRFVMACQMLSQFMDIESVFLEVKRVLMPGGIFCFTEEPLRRLLSLRLYRCPYQNRMKAWERKLFDWGLLGYLVRDVIGAEQEESFGIRQNHKMYLTDWHRLIRKHFAEHHYQIFVPERGWGERVVKRLAVRLDPCRSEWRAARLLGGTLAALCRKPGVAAGPVPAGLERFEAFLRCPDCHSGLSRDASETLRCPACGYSAPNEGGVFNLLPSAERAELYPGDRQDILDFSLPSHAERLLQGWYELEGSFGNKYRWIGPRATAKLGRVQDGPQRLRLRGYADEMAFRQGRPVRVEARVNGTRVVQQTIERPGLFVLEGDVPDAAEYALEINASPTWSAPADGRVFTVTLSMIRLIPRE